MVDSSPNVELGVKEFLERNKDCSHVNKEVFYSCYSKIKPYLDNLLLFPRLMCWKLVKNFEDIEKLVNSSPASPKTNSPAGIG